MKLIKYPDRSQWNEILKRPILETENLFDTVRNIINRVRAGGDRVVMEYEAVFDKAELTSLAVTSAEIEEAEHHKNGQQAGGYGRHRAADGQHDGNGRANHHHGAHHLHGLHLHKAANRLHVAGAALDKVTRLHAHMIAVWHGLQMREQPVAQALGQSQIIWSQHVIAVLIIKAVHPVPAVHRIACPAHGIFQIHDAGTF